MDDWLQGQGSNEGAEVLKLVLLWRRGAVACLSLAHGRTSARDTLKRCVKFKGGCNREVWCTTVEQLSVSLQSVTNTVGFKTCSQKPMRRLQARFSKASFGSQ